MQRTIVMLPELIKDLKTTDTTIRIYLSSWVMSRYFVKNGMIISKESINKFYTYMLNKGNHRMADLWKNKYPEAEYIDNIEENA